MNREEYSNARMTDMHIDELVQNVQQGQRTCQSLSDDLELRLTQDICRAYQTEACEDARSLERVLARLIEDQVEVPSKVLFLPHVSQRQEEISTMQHSIDTHVQGKNRRGWQKRSGLIAAALFFTLLVGGVLTVLGVIHAGNASQATGGSALSNSGFASIASVALSDSANQTAQASSVQHFTVGQTIWLNGMVNMGKKAGSNVLMVKWYEDGHLIATSKRGFQTPKDQSVATALKAITLHSHQMYMQPGDGKAEVYWNGQLVTTLHFVVTQKPQKP
ncbi:MAG TPA: hypothetical protein VFQ30_06760 [Ktedonobacteraceae bacterium]|nr:hypothetical protein [Ktedonobacteraceae bacterium]